MLVGSKLWTSDADAKVKRERSAAAKLRFYNVLARLVIYIIQ